MGNLNARVTLSRADGTKVLETRRRALEGLVVKGLVTRTIDADGREMFTLTDRGRMVYNSQHNGGTNDVPDREDLHL